MRGFAAPGTGVTSSPVSPPKRPPTAGLRLVGRPIFQDKPNEQYRADTEGDQVQRQPVIPVEQDHVARTEDSRHCCPKRNQHKEVPHRELQRSPSETLPESHRCNHRPCKQSCGSDIHHQTPRPEFLDLMAPGRSKRCDEAFVGFVVL